MDCLMYNYKMTIYNEIHLSFHNYVLWEDKFSSLGWASRLKLAATETGHKFRQLIVVFISLIDIIIITVH